MGIVIRKVNLCVCILFVLCIFFIGGCSDMNKAANQYKGTETEKIQQVLADFITALDSGDSDAIKGMLSVNAQKSNGVDEQIEQLFSFYPGNTQRHDWDGHRLFSESSNGLFSQHAQVSVHFALFSEGTAYYCRITLRYSDTFKNRIGVHRICMVSEKVYCHENFAWPDESGVFIVQDIDGDYETRRVGGYAIQFTPIERTISEQDILEFLETSTSFDEFQTIFGEPNGTQVSPIYPYYELPSVDGEPRYAVVTKLTAENAGIPHIQNVQIYNAEEKLYTLWKRAKE